MRKYRINEGVRINRDVKKRECAFTDVFEGFQQVQAVKRIFGKDTPKTLAGLMVKVPNNARWGYMWVDEKKGVLVVNRSYLREGDIASLYLDVIHELVHIKQRMEGRDLFDEKYEYVDRPTEIEAYTVAAGEALRIGMSRRQVLKYLEIPGWLSGDVLKRLCRNIGM